MNIRPAPRSERTQANNDPDDNTTFAILSLVLGIVGIFLVGILSMVCGAGIIGCIIGIILGINALKSRGKLMAIAGIIFSTIGIIIGIVNIVHVW